MLLKNSAHFQKLKLYFIKNPKINQKPEQLQEFPKILKKYLKNSNILQKIQNILKNFETFYNKK